jgi:hypothetical protein
MEEWWSSDGFHRLDMDFDEGWMQSVEVEDAQHLLSYDSHTHNQQVQQRGSDSDRGSPAPFRNREPVFSGEKSAVGRMFEFMRDVKGWIVTEERERSLWAGAVDVVEAQGVERSLPAFPVAALVGDTVKYRVELDPGTGRLLSLTQYVLMENGRWEPSYWVDLIEWDADILASVRDYRFPAATTVTETRWWADRTKNVVAEGATADWQVKLHALEADSKGRLYVTLSRWPTQGSSLDTVRSFAHWAWTLTEVAAVDQYGVQYLQSDTRSDLTREGGYWTAVLKPQSHVVPLALPRRIAVTIRLYERVYERSESGERAVAESEGQAVTFANLARPALQPSADLFADSVKTVTY